MAESPDGFEKLFEKISIVEDEDLKDIKDITLIKQKLFCEIIKNMLEHQDEEMRACRTFRYIDSMTNLLAPFVYYFKKRIMEHFDNESKDWSSFIKNVDWKRIETFILDRGLSLEDWKNLEEFEDKKKWKYGDGYGDNNDAECGFAYLEYLLDDKYKDNGYEKYYPALKHLLEYFEKNPIDY